MPESPQPELFPPETAPPDAVGINARCLLQTRDGHRAVLVAGVPIAHYAVGDAMAEAYAMVQLVTQGGRIRTRSPARSVAPSVASDATSAGLRAAAWSRSGVQAGTRQASHASTVRATAASTPCARRARAIARSRPPSECRRRRSASSSAGWAGRRRSPCRSSCRSPGRPRTQPCPDRRRPASSRLRPPGRPRTQPCPDRRRPDRRFIAVGCRDRPTRVWDTAHARMLAELPSSTPLKADGFISASPAVSAAGDLAAVPRGTTTAIYELPGGRLLRKLEHDAAVSAIAFADSGGAMISGALDGSVHVLREDGAALTLQASSGISAAALLPDGRVLVADAERHLRAFAADGTVLADLTLPVRIMSLERAAARVVALPSAGGEAGPPLLIDLDTFRIVAPLEGHVGRVFSARWVPGNRVLTAGADGTARLWDGLTGRLLQTYKGGPRFLRDAALLSDLVVGGDADGLLRFWDTATGAMLWTLTVHKSAVIGVHLEGTDIVTRGFTGEISRWWLPRSEAVIAACARHSPCAIVP